MANTLATTSLVAKATIEELFNILQKAGTIPRTLEGDFRTAENGTVISMRRPYYIASTDGAVVGGSDTSDIIDGTVDVTVDNRKKTVYAIKSSQQALEITDDRINKMVKASAAELGSQIELSIANKGRDRIWNYIDASAGATLDDFADADATMAAQGVNILLEKYGCVTPSVARVLSKEVSTAFSFPSVTRVTDAMDRAKIGSYSNIMFMQDQVLATHLSGVASGTILVNGAAQNVTYASVAGTFEQSLILDGATVSITDLFKKGDVINIADVFGINKNTRQSTGELQDFIVKADATSDGSGDITVTVSPPIIVEADAAAGYNTVSAVPADDAAITVKTGSAATRKENMVYCAEAFQLAMVTLPQNQSGVDQSTETIEGLSLRVSRQFDFDADEDKWRIDAEWAVECVQPYYAHRVATSK
jgi:hypothetical protein